RPGWRSPYRNSNRFTCTVFCTAAEGEEASCVRMPPARKTRETSSSRKTRRRDCIDVGFQGAGAASVQPGCAGSRVTGFSLREFCKAHSTDYWRRGNQKLIIMCLYLSERERG